MDNLLNLTSAQIWAKIQDSLQKDLSGPAYDRWIQPIEPLEFEENLLVLGIPDEFFKNWVVDHYGSMILACLNDALGVPGGLLDFRIHASAVQQPSTQDSPSAPTFSRPTAPIIPNESVLNSKYTFESFVVGPSNRFAHAASMAVAEAPAKSYNPLFIYGPVGLGKTHLMQAVGHEMMRLNPKAKVLYMTSERFTNQLINAIKTGTTVKFRDKYRTVDCLLIDDIHFIGGKEATMEEFFNTFNALYDAHKKIVVSSDKPPKEIANMEERLISRFEWGLVTDIRPPDFETRSAILRKKAEREGLNIRTRSRPSSPTRSNPISGNSKEH